MTLEMVLWIILCALCILALLIRSLIAREYDDTPTLVVEIVAAALMTILLIMLCRGHK